MTTCPRCNSYLADSHDDVSKFKCATYLIHGDLIESDICRMKQIRKLRHEVMLAYNEGATHGANNWQTSRAKRISEGEAPL